MDGRKLKTGRSCPQLCLDEKYTSVRVMVGAVDGKKGQRGAYDPVCERVVVDVNSGRVSGKGEGAKRVLAAFAVLLSVAVLTASFQPHTCFLWREWRRRGTPPGLNTVDVVKAATDASAPHNGAAKAQATANGRSLSDASSNESWRESYDCMALPKKQPINTISDSGCGEGKCSKYVITAFTVEHGSAAWKVKDKCRLRLKFSKGRNHGSYPAWNDPVELPYLDCSDSMASRVEHDETALGLFYVLRLISPGRQQYCCTSPATVNEVGRENAVDLVLYNEETGLYITASLERPLVMPCIATGKKHSWWKMYRTHPVPDPDTDLRNFCNHAGTTGSKQRSTICTQLSSRVESGTPPLLRCDNGNYTTCAITSSPLRSTSIAVRYWIRMQSHA